MDISDLVNKEKLRCDNIVSIVLLAGIVVLFIFFRLIIFVSLMVFPIFALFLNGIFYFNTYFFNRVCRHYKRLYCKSLRSSLSKIEYINWVFNLWYYTSYVLLCRKFLHIIVNLSNISSYFKWNFKIWSLFK